MTDNAPAAITLYPHAAGREWSTEPTDEWKRHLGVGYVRADLVVLERSDDRGPRGLVPEDEREMTPQTGAESSDRKGER